VTTRAEARRAKAALVDLLGDHATVNGIGVTRVGGAYAVKVNLSRAPGPDLTIPETIDGVPVTWEVIGPVSKR
jgi:hypothetical protein